MPARIHFASAPLIFAAVGLALTGVPAAQAKAPANDRCGHPKVIKIDSLTAGTTVGATRERFEPWLGSGGSVWYRVRATRTGPSR